jgi:catalase
MQWDFWTLNPESAHQVTWLFGDRGIPATWRHMDGFGSHTYMWVNAAGEKFWVKYHFKTDQGVQGLTADEAARVVGEDADFHRRDLFEAIRRGDHPSWTAYVQVMPYETARTYRFNPFDLTKVWPHRDFPLIRLGRLVLDRNPDNFFAQIEQAAFEPSALVPGIGVSPDKMLLGRMFAYADTHRYRIGTNYLQLPVNKPTVPVRTYTFDGQMRFEHAGAAPVYAPNSYGGPAADPVRGEDHGWHADGDMVRSAYAPHPEDDDVTQPGALVRDVMDDAARERLVANVVGALLSGVSTPVRERAVAYWRAIDKAVGDRVALGVGVA